MPCAFEGQGWSPDHPDQLPLSFLLARAFKLLGTEPMMVCVMIKIFSKFNFEKKKKEAGMEPYTVTIVGTEVFPEVFQRCIWCFKGVIDVPEVYSERP